jgi:hypothetical protein
MGRRRLVGHQTRRHHDLDLVLLEFERDEPRARSALGLLGFRQVLRWHSSTRWMPSRSVMDDGAGRCIDLVNLEAAQLASTLGHRDPVGELSSEDGHSSLFVSGIVGRRLAVFLSAEAQLLLHTASISEPITSGMRTSCDTRSVPNTHRAPPWLSVSGIGETHLRRTEPRPNRRDRAHDPCDAFWLASHWARSSSALAAAGAGLNSRRRNANEVASGGPSSEMNDS